MLHQHQDRIHNWGVTGGTTSGSVVEGFNNNAKQTTKKAYGFRELKTLEIALDRQRTVLPAPAFTHSCR